MSSTYTPSTNLAFFSFKYYRLVSKRFVLPGCLRSGLGNLRLGESLRNIVVTTGWQTTYLSSFPMKTINELNVMTACKSEVSQLHTAAVKSVPFRLFGEVAEREGALRAFELLRYICNLGTTNGLIVSYTKWMGGDCIARHSGIMHTAELCMLVKND